jgi:hypothetical protein
VSYHFERTLLLEHDPVKLGGYPPIRSLRDADVRHQQAAMTQGYSSLAEMAIDELIVMVREMQERLDTLERQLGYGELTS